MPYFLRKPQDLFYFWKDVWRGSDLLEKPIARKTMKYKQGLIFIGGSLAGFILEKIFSYVESQAVSTLPTILSQSPILILDLVFLGIAVIGFILIINEKRKSKDPYTIRVSNYQTELGVQLNKRYGLGFTDDDEEILRAIKLEKNTVEEIAIFTNSSERDVERRLEFMEEKEVLYEIHGIWDFEDDGLKRYIK